MTSSPGPTWRGFASDNYAGVHPAVLAGIAAANSGHQVAYGADVYTDRLHQVFARHFGDGVTVWPVFNGTGANVVSLQAMLPRWGAVICAESAHVHTDENVAPERVGGIKLLAVPTPDGKLTPELIDRQAWGFDFEHRAKPSAVSITQTTELGTCYTAAEIREISEHAHKLGMKVHLDGARIANAAATLGGTLREFTADAGVDMVSFGGTKNGAMGAEAVVVLDTSDEESFGLIRLRKMNMQLSSKMRFISAQLLALLEEDLWLNLARHSNAMAHRLAAAVGDHVRITQQVQANAVFAILDSGVADRLRERGARFYDWDHATGEVRWMCAWDTSEADVDTFAEEVRRAVAAGST